MAALTVFDVNDPLNAAAMLLNDLNDATLVAQSSSAWHGRAATLLTISVKATLGGTSRFVPKIDLRVWLDANGIPIAAERDSNYAAMFVVVTASNSRAERWELATADDQLYAARTEEVDRASPAKTSPRRGRSRSRHGGADMIESVGRARDVCACPRIDTFTRWGVSGSSPLAPTKSPPPPTLLERATSSFWSI